MIGEASHAARARAVCRAIYRIFMLYTVPDNTATAGRATWCEQLDGAFKGIENMFAAVIEPHQKCGIVIISADFAYRHDFILLPAPIPARPPY